MESTFVLRRNELTNDFVETIKTLFKNQEELQITVTASQDFGLNKIEDSELYWKRLNKAANNVEQRNNVVEMSETELDEFAIDLLKK